jgi:hypothetical protein
MIDLTLFYNRFQDRIVNSLRNFVSNDLHLQS